MADQVISSIPNADVKLKHVETVDKSAPVIESDVKIGTNNHGSLLAEVSKGTDLKHVETDDKSKPAIDSDVHIKENQHNALFSEIKKN